MDLLLPELSGYALLDILNAKGFRIPVLVISSVADVSDNLAHQGIAGLLLKPIDRERLLIHIDSILKLDEAAKRMGRGAPIPPPATTTAQPRVQIQEAEEEEAAPPFEPEPEPMEPTPLEGQPLVLVVEDEPDMRLLLTTILEHNGFKVIAADDGQEGLQLAQKNLPDAILLDIMLPRMDGFQVCRLLKFSDRYRKIPIVILTARSQQADRELADASGAEAYIVKPFESDMLVRTIRRVIAMKR